MSRASTLPLAGPFTATRRGCPLHVTSEGPADAPVVVLTHGFTMDHRTFDAQAAALAQRFRVIRWDLHGHGRSRPFGATFTLRQAAEDLLGILDALHIEKAVFVGHSMGGLLSQEIEFMAPDRVLGLAMISSTCLTCRQPSIIRWSGPVTSTALRLWPDPWTHRNIGWIAGVRSHTRTYASQAAACVSKQDRISVWRGVLASFHEEPRYRIRVPLLLMEGQWDWLVAGGLIRLLADRWVARDRPWRHVIVPGAGHNAQQDNPEIVNRELLAFLDHILA